MENPRNQDKYQAVIEKAKEDPDLDKRRRIESVLDEETKKHEAAAAHRIAGSSLITKQYYRLLQEGLIESE
jgi:hypothetical protein